MQKRIKSALLSRSSHPSQSFYLCQTLWTVIRLCQQRNGALRYDVGGYHSRLSRGIPGFESQYRNFSFCLFFCSLLCFINIYSYYLRYEVTSVYDHLLKYKVTWAAPLYYPVISKFLVGISYAIAMTMNLKRSMDNLRFHFSILPIPLYLWSLSLDMYICISFLRRLMLDKHLIEQPRVTHFCSSLQSLVFP